MEKLLLILIFASSVMVAQSFIKSCGVGREATNKGKYGYNNGMNQTEYLGTINHYRMMLMKAAGISNMFELKYDPSLEDEIRKMNSCEDLNHGPNYRIENQRDAEASTIVGKVVANIENQAFAEEAKITPEKFHPGQTFVAWCDLKEVCNAKYNGGEMKHFYIERVFFFGPKGTYADSDFKYGKPGADCPDGVVTAPCKMNCGLCKGPEIPVKTTTSRAVIQSKEVATENSIDADRAASFFSIFLIYSIILLVNIVNVY
ncbi:unnamed protein product [Caenorhabditis brenneri]